MSGTSPAVKGMCVDPVIAVQQYSKYCPYSEVGMFFLLSVSCAVHKVLCEYLYVQRLECRKCC